VHAVLLTVKPGNRIVTVDSAGVDLLVVDDVLGPAGVKCLARAGQPLVRI
jgi:hypothetical protein